MPQPNDPSQFPPSSQSEPIRDRAPNWSNQDFAPTFRLIDTIVPKASCLYHQILPLSLVDNCLTLGMVNIKDQAAQDYVRSLLASKNYSLAFEPIDSKTLQLILSAQANSTQPTHLTPDFNDQPTFIVDNPDQLSPAWSESSDDAIASQPPDSPPLQSPSPPSTNFNEQPTLIVDNPDNISPDLAGTTPPASVPQNPNSPTAPTPNPASEKTSAAKPAMEVQAYSTSESLEFLVNLSPQKLWQELLSRTISEGIGRLYFERHPHHGRIFWSKNGILQLSLENVTPAIFQSTIDEFKRLVQLPTTPLQQAKKGELERYYRQERLLMRWQVIPGKYGEEGTLQVLRGKASELYQQRQIDELASQALRLAESLERKLKQIQTLSRSHPTRINVLPSLRQTHTKINRYLEALEKEK